MKKQWNVLWTVGCALSVMVLLSACDDGGGGRTETIVVTNIVDGEVVVETVVVETEGLTEQPADEGVVDEDEPRTVNFAKITPAGLSATRTGGSLFGGADYVLRCDPIQGAMRYAFTTSLGTSDTAPVGNPQVTIRVPASELGRKQTFEVYATNLSDVNTRTARKTFAAN